MKVIGLTGGTGSGKSTVSTYLREKGCCIIDADKISRELTAKGGDAIEPIRAKFGDGVFFEDGSLHRKKLADIVFNDKEKLKVLEEITTQNVIRIVTEKIEELRKIGDKRIVILDAPLLFECGMNGFADENWLVICDKESRIKRLMKRDGLERHSIMDRMANQLSDEEKLLMADVVIDNSGSLNELYSRIDRLIERVENEEI